jgi:general stress protein 26
MATDINDKAAVQTRLWDEIEKQQIGMLGAVGGASHPFQPMTAFLERADNRLWFFTYKDTELAEAAAGGVQAAFLFQDGRHLYASIAGELRTDYDRERMNRFWNAAVAAWYPEGKDDPRLTLLRLDARDAEVWIQTAGPARFAFEIAKANATREQPDLGGHARLNLH